jgi:hypothetical protein
MLNPLKYLEKIRCDNHVANCVLNCALVGVATTTIYTGFLVFKSHKDPEWLKASKIIAQNLLTQIIQANATDTIDLEAIKAMKLDQGIILIDFNSQNLCGQAGCLYVAYTKEGDRVLSLILQPQSDLFTINQADPNRTCIDIKQPQDNQTLIHTYCYEGNKFIKTISSAAN